MGAQPGLHSMTVFLHSRDPGMSLRIYVHIEPDSLKVTPLDDGTTEITWWNAHPDRPRACCDFLYPDPSKIIIPRGLDYDVLERSPSGVRVERGGNT